MKLGHVLICDVCKAAYRYPAEITTDGLEKIGWDVRVDDGGFVITAECPACVRAEEAVCRKGVVKLEESSPSAPRAMVRLLGVYSVELTIDETNAWTKHCLERSLWTHTRTLELLAAGFTQERVVKADTMLGAVMKDWNQSLLEDFKWAEAWCNTELVQLRTKKR